MKKKFLILAVMPISGIAIAGAKCYMVKACGKSTGTCWEGEGQDQWDKELQEMLCEM
jgi:hypothetical protein